MKAYGRGEVEVLVCVMQPVHPPERECSEMKMKMQISRDRAERSTAEKRANKGRRLAASSPIPIGRENGGADAESWVTGPIATPC